MNVILVRGVTKDIAFTAKQEFIVGIALFPESGSVDVEDLYVYVANLLQLRHAFFNSIIDLNEPQALIAKL